MFDNTPKSSAANAVAGVAPSQRNRGERRTLLYLEDVYDPDVHPVSEKEKYIVPFENELIADVENGYLLRCAKVDYEGNLKATMVPWSLNNPTDQNVIDQDWLFGMQGGPMIGEALLSVDFSVRPNVARVDATIMRPGAAYALLYRGPGPSNKGNIISVTYDQGGVMQNNEVPTRLAEIVDRTNLEIMTTGPFSVTENEQSLPNGSQCFLAFYDQGGNFIPPGQLVRTQHSAYMKDHRIGTKYIDTIRLVSPWFSNSNNPEKVIVPINVNLLSLELRAEVVYSDGSTSGLLPVNGGKFRLEGINEHRPTWPGQTSEVVLIYQLGPNEQFYKSRPGNPLFERRIYTLEAGEADGAYSPRLYTYPQWDASLAGYRLQHFMYDLDRKTFVDVSAFVTLNDNSPAWRPSGYGITQSMIFNLNLRDVAPTYVSATFIQHVDISLYRDINTPGKKFDVSFVFNQPTYQALSLKVLTNDGSKSVANVTNGFLDQAAWLNGLYRGVYPSFAIWNEAKAPEPTHFYLMHEDGRKWLFSIADWNKNLPVPVSMQTGKTWYMAWVSRDGQGNELQLAATGVIVTV